MKKIAIILVATFFIGNSFAQQVNTEKLDSLFNILNTNKKAMGSLAISKNGKLLYAKSIGFIDAEQKIAANNQTKYRIGSISKMFTAALVFQLIEEKKISLETKLDKYFPTVPNAKKISIGNMLQHRTGIFNITDDSTYADWCEKAISQKDMVSKISKFPSQFEPNSKTSYSNSNFILLTYIIEKITKKSYAENVTQRICKKINLKNTYYGGKIKPAANEANSFTIKNKDWEIFPQETDISVPQGAGAIVATPSDLTTFIEALFAGKLVKSNSLAQMQTMKDGMGMGMFGFPFYDHKALGHTGGIDGFASNVAYFPKDSMAIAYVGNGNNYSVNDIMLGALSIYFKKEFKLPNFNAVVAKDIDFNKFVGVYGAMLFPLKITITTDGNLLMAQATGQAAFPLEYKGDDTFGFEAAGIELKFDLENEKVKLNQGGRSFVLNKEK